MPKPLTILKVLFVAAMLAALVVPGWPGVDAAPIPPPRFSKSNQDDAIRQALAQSIQQHLDTPAFVIYSIQASQIIYSRNGDQALVWMVMVDKSTGKTLATEPGLALAYRSADQWQITQLSDPDWQSRLEALPPELLTSQIRDNFITPSGAPTPQFAGPVGGFFLPWAAGQTKWLTMGARHLSCLTTCRYATDWADGTHFPILAAKGGTVFAFRDTCANDNHSCVNYLLLEDRTTNPYTYQIYFHLEYNSILPALKTANPPPVLQGQYIANVDNTGHSTGSHLHFMVVTNPFFGSDGYGDAYWWSTSIDITFRDVHTNWDAATQGGRPCTADDVAYGLCTQWQSSYTSGNTGIQPPTGGLTLPADRSLVNSSNLITSGWASSVLGITRMQLVANYAGAWHAVGPSLTTNPFSINLDVCASGIPEGVFDLALRAWDSAGGQSQVPLGLRHLVKDTHCTPTPAPPPACVPDANQVALFSQPNFNGDCLVLDQGNFPDFSYLYPLSEHHVSSLQVGGNVLAVLYDGANFSQRQETFIADDHNLEDNRVSDQQVSSVKILARSTVIPGDPTIPGPYGPGGSKVITTNDSVVLAWGMGDGAATFLSRLYQGFIDCNNPPPSPFKSRQPDDYLPGQTWPVGTLPAGNYSICLRGQVPGFNASIWVRRKFTVTTALLIAGGLHSLPFNADMETVDPDWIASGLWRRASDPVDGAPNNHDWVFNNASSADYAGALPTLGDLTSPPVVIPPTGSTYLRFDYRYLTESSNLQWDQRWVQISSNDGPFVNLLQLSGEVMDFWLHSPAIDLSAYKGSKIRVRFHFDSIDTYHNAGNYGWRIDNFSVNATPPDAGCTAEPVGGDNAFTSAAQLHYGDTVSADICPGGDVDYYKLTAAQGDVVIADINAQTLNPPSDLDPTLGISVDSDPLSILAYNDDELLGEQLDPFLVFTASQSSTYYLRVRAWDHPSVGGSSYKYTLHLQRASSGSGDSTDPTISLTNPAPGTAWKQGTQTITAAAVDNNGGSGIKNVTFYWHAGDWDTAEWQAFFTDWNGANGWNAPLDLSQFGEGEDLAIAAVATDWAGNASVAVDWDVVIDDYPPNVSLVNLLASTEDSAISLHWNADDINSGIAYFDLEVNRDNMGWTTLDPHLSGTARQSWYIGEFGHHYDFRIKGVDFAGNESSFYSTGTTVTACRPDPLESDGSLASATLLPLNQAQPHNLCGTADQDWVKFTPLAGKTYYLWAAPDANSPATPVLGLYNSSGSKLMEVAASGYGQWALLKWAAPNNGTYYLNVHSMNPAVAGTLTTYNLWVGQGSYQYLPVIEH